MAILIRLADRLDPRTQEWVHEFLDHNELGLALETMADALSEAASPISDDEHAEMLDLVADMQMDGRVPRALALCPRGA
jgi:hypothetical protein